MNAATPLGPRGRSAMSLVDARKVDPGLSVETFTGMDGYVDEDGLLFREGLLRHLARATQGGTPHRVIAAAMRAVVDRALDQAGTWRHSMYHLVPRLVAKMPHTLLRPIVGERVYAIRSSYFSPATVASVYDDGTVDLDFLCVSHDSSHAHESQ